MSVVKPGTCTPPCPPCLLRPNSVLSRQAKMELARSYYRHDPSSVSAFNPNSSESDIPLRPYDPERDPDFEESTHQRWDERGHAVGYASDPRLHAPRPRQPSFKPSALYASPDAAVVETLSRESEDEWSNAHTPKASRPPDVATISMPAPAPIPPPLSFPPSEYSNTATPPSSSIPLPLQSTHSAHTQSTPSSTTAQYATYQPEHLALGPMSGSLGMGSEAAQPYYNPHSPPATGSESVPPRAFSPPPSYR
jgi:hypothetical protein